MEDSPLLLFIKLLYYLINIYNIIELFFSFLTQTNEYI